VRPGDEILKTKLFAMPVMIAAVLLVGAQTGALAATTTGDIHIESNATLVGVFGQSSVTVVVDVTCASTADSTLPGDIRVEVTQPNSPFGPADGAGDRGFFVTPGQSQKLAVEVDSLFFDVGSATATASTPINCTSATDTRTIHITA